MAGALAAVSGGFAPARAGPIQQMMPGTGAAGGGGGGYAQLQPQPAAALLDEPLAALLGRMGVGGGPQQQFQKQWGQ